jgi:O-antigen biosynthesis protein
MRTGPAAASSQRSTVAVVIPCHNYGRFLAEAVQSVINQTKAADQIVIVDDASIDDTSQVISSLTAAHPQITVVAHTQRVGAPAAFRSGVSATTTDYVMVLSADDRLTERYLEASSAVLDAGFDVAQTKAVLFGERIGEWPISAWSLDGLLEENRHHGSMLFRRAAYDRVGGYRNRSFEDWDLWLRMAATGSEAHPAEGCALEYRQHGPSRNAKSVWKARRARIALVVCNAPVLGVRTTAVSLARRLV